jgi:glycosyltransferase involved in cell wall biosynthesis
MIAVVIPCYRVKRHILDVLARIPEMVGMVIVVDDACPEGTGRYVEEHLLDPRVQVLYHTKNQGVGGATLTGYKAAYQAGADILVKVDGDGQMDLSLLPLLIEPILSGQADYSKGNRFFDPHYLTAMPQLRVFGNLILSFAAKLSSGYWDLMDPTNGYTALAAPIYPLLDVDRLDRRYFFESDFLFRLGLVQAVVRDVPMRPQYGNEASNLSIGLTALEFPVKHISRFFKRILYHYFVRDFNIGSLQLLVGVVMTTFGITFGLIKWYQLAGVAAATSGTVMLAGLPVIIGFQSLLAAVQFDILRIPRVALHPRLKVLDAHYMASQVERQSVSKA